MDGDTVSVRKDGVTFIMRTKAWSVPWGMAAASFVISAVHVHSVTLRMAITPLSNQKFITVPRFLGLFGLPLVVVLVTLLFQSISLFKSKQVRSDARHAFGEQFLTYVLVGTCTLLWILFLIWELLIIHANALNT